MVFGKILGGGTRPVRPPLNPPLKWSLAWEGVFRVMTFDLDLYFQCHSALTLKINLIWINSMDNYGGGGGGGGILRMQALLLF